MIVLTVICCIAIAYSLGLSVAYWRLKNSKSDKTKCVNKPISESAQVCEKNKPVQNLPNEDTSSSPINPHSDFTPSDILLKADEAQRLHQTFQKFIPRQFVDHITKDGKKGSAESLGLGYADEDEVAVMFCDIRGFTGLSEQMSPQQLMNFLNSYFLRMNAPIHNNGGFIDKFIGDAIMALFDHPNGTPSDKAQDAINAALDLQKALALYNQHRANSGYKAIKNGIGLHFGPVILGTVGSDDRMDTTVLGDAVNIAQRIESLSDYFGSDILTSRTLIDEASKKRQFAHRTLDNLMLKGKSSSVEVIEVFEHLSEELMQQKSATIAIIEAGIAMRNQHKFEQALSIFEEAQIQFPNDNAIKHHITICQRLLNTKDWDGIVRL